MISRFITKIPIQTDQINQTDQIDQIDVLSTPTLERLKVHLHQRPPHLQMFSAYALNIPNDINILHDLNVPNLIDKVNAANAYNGKQ